MRLSSVTETILCSFKQTFLRQKVFLASSDSDPIYESEKQKNLDKKDEHKAFCVSDENHDLGTRRKVTGCNSCQNDEVDAFRKTVMNSEHACSRVNVNATAVGALRYALHLRFVCPFSKKSSISVSRSDPSLALERNKKDSDGQRRFYLYDDLKVVFPQRHSDADEGKVCILYLISFRNS